MEGLQSLACWNIYHSFAKRFCKFALLTSATATNNATLLGVMIRREKVESWDFSGQCSFIMTADKEREREKVKLDYTGGHEMINRET